MVTDNKLVSNFSPEVLYANFEEFLANYQAMIYMHSMDYVCIYALVRLARDDIDTARSVFDWSVKRTAMSMLTDRRGGPIASALSEQGQFWGKRAEELFGQNPRKSLSIVEGIYLLEKIAIWADIKLRHRFPSMTLTEFRKRPETNEETFGKVGWLDQFYQEARGKAMAETELFVCRRDTAIMISLAALAGGNKTPPSDEEIDDAMSQRLATHQSLSKYSGKSRGISTAGTMVHTQRVIDWVLGPYESDVSF